MYNLESQFKKFYGNYVVLKDKEKKSLLSKKTLNITRLKDGLKTNNEENKTNYKLCEEPIIQGSVAMATVTQNDSNDYDIDVAIVFEKDNIPDEPKKVKKIILEALLKYSKNFSEPPEPKDNCVTVKYKLGYHIDFAVYRRFKDHNGNYVYEHCGKEWAERNPRSINKWFLDENKAKDYQLREVVRLLKIFTKSRGWNDMPGGLILSVLANEAFMKYERMDERFYHTLVAIRDRLAWNKEVYNPTDITKSLKLKKKDETKLNNLYTRLDKELKKLNILFDENNCTHEKAVEAWESFFCHSYWTKQKEEIKKGIFVSESTLFKKAFAEEEHHYYQETEEYIDHLMPVVIVDEYIVSLNCRVSKDGRFAGWLNEMNRNGQKVKKGCILNFQANTNVPKPYNVYWKFRNKGTFAEKENKVRGQIEKTDLLTNQDGSSFEGNHYVECYIVKNGVCVAKGRINVPIG